jgi:hypothetical protein
MLTANPTGLERRVCPPLGYRRVPARSLAADTSGRTAYAVWTGIGAVGIVMMGIVLFGETLNSVCLSGIALVLAGIIALRPAPA